MINLEDFYNILLLKLRISKSSLEYRNYFDVRPIFDKRDPKTLTSQEVAEKEKLRSDPNKIRLLQLLLSVKEQDSNKEIATKNIQTLIYNASKRLSKNEYEVLFQKLQDLVIVVVGIRVALDPELKILADENGLMREKIAVSKNNDTILHAVFADEKVFSIIAGMIKVESLNILDFVRNRKSEAKDDSRKLVIDLWNDNSLLENILVSKNKLALTAFYNSLDLLEPQQRRGVIRDNIQYLEKNAEFAIMDVLKDDPHLRQNLNAHFAQAMDKKEEVESPVRRSAFKAFARGDDTILSGRANAVYQASGKEDESTFKPVRPFGWGGGAADSLYSEKKLMPQKTTFDGVEFKSFSSQKKEEKLTRPESLPNMTNLFNNPESPVYERLLKDLRGVVSAIKTPTGVPMSDSKNECEK